MPPNSLAGVSQVPPIVDAKIRERVTTPLSEDEHTLTAFGDISLSNIDFVPGPPTELSPERVRQKKGSTKGLVEVTKDAVCPPSYLKSRIFSDLLQPRTPQLMRKVLPPSPSKASLARALPEFSFSDMVEELKRSREAEDVNPSPKKVASAVEETNPTFEVRAPQPTRLINLKNLGLDAGAIFHPKIEDSPSVVKDSASGVGDKNREFVAPVEVSKPKQDRFRGGAKMPRRPPLPRWEVDDVGPRGHYGYGLGIPRHVRPMT